MEKPNKKQLLSALSFVLSVAIFLLALYVFITSLSARSKNGQAEIFGFSFAIVLTDSMAPEIRAGDLIIVKSCAITEIKEGDNAVFLGLSGTFKDKRVVHRVVGIYDTLDAYGDKSIYLETWGISNPKHDDDYVYSTNFIGKEIFHSTFLGAIMSFLRSPLNWFFLILVITFIYFAVSQGKKIVKFIKEKGMAEQPAEEQKDESESQVDGQEGEVATENQNEIALPGEVAKSHEVAEDEIVSDIQTQDCPNDIVNNVREETKDIKNANNDKDIE